MTQTPFIHGWTVRSGDGEAVPVNLPHDGMIAERRSRGASTEHHGGYFPGGRYLYSKSWEGEEGRNSLLFEGIAGEAIVRLNGRELARSSSFYRELVVDLDGLQPGAVNLLEVEVDNTATPNSRWYTGSGIYRPVWLRSTGPTRFSTDGVRYRTVSIARGSALLELWTETDGPPLIDANVRVALRRDGEALATAEGRIGALQFEVPAALLWSDEDPHLYDAEVVLLDGDVEVDRRDERIGIRTIDVDVDRGLRINGKPTLLRGACVHHDSGLLGAATHRASEFRRVRLLKQAGYNAIRSSHNPLSRDMLDACDQLGMFVLDESTDVWFAPKTAHDLAARFEETWPADARSMVAKDRNHPSVIMYSIGNEIAELGTEAGVDATRRISALVAELDPTRPTTVAANFLLSLLASQGRSLFSTEKSDPERQQTKATSTMANVIADKLGSIMSLVSRLPKAGAVTRDALAAVDVAGYNYAWSRYRGDGRRYPGRVILGTESMPGDIAKIWPLVESLPHVIGDFAWTGWDYLGEAGLGSWSYGDDRAVLSKPYPQLTAGCGAIDIIGTAGAPTLLSRAVWGLLPAPAIAVRPLDRSGQTVHRVAWRSTDGELSWAWHGMDGVMAEIEVYSADEEVELLVNGRSLGRRRAGEARGFVARYRTPYEPGEVVAIGYRGGVETGRDVLRSAGPVALVLVPESDTIVGDGRDLAFVRVELRDDAGVLEMLEDDTVTVHVEGPAVLAGFGSGATSTEGSFVDHVHETHRGRALAILRSTGEAGTVRVTARSENHGDAVVELAAHAEVVDLRR